MKTKTIMYPPVNKEKFCELYQRHLAAIKDECLNSPEDFAAQLAWRDHRINQLQEFVQDLETDIARLLEGF